MNTHPILHKFDVASISSQELHDRSSKLTGEKQLMHVSDNAMAGKVSSLRHYKLQEVSFLKPNAVSKLIICLFAEKQERYKERIIICLFAEKQER